MSYNESNPVSLGTGRSPEIVQEVGQSASELTPPESLALIVKKLNIIINVLLIGLGVPESDANIGDEQSSTTS